MDSTPSDRLARQLAQAIQALGCGRRRGTERQPSEARLKAARRFRRLLPISPLSTGFSPHFSLSRLGGHVHGDLVIGTAVPASPIAGNGRRARQVAKGPISAGRQCRSSFGSGSGASREEAPEESIFCRATRLRHFLGSVVSEAGRESGRPKKGRGTSVERKSSGLHRDRWEATPELVSQDRKRVPWDQVTNTGRSFARRSGGWQRCRPPFLFGAMDARLRPQLARKLPNTGKLTPRRRAGPCGKRPRAARRVEKFPTSRVSGLAGGRLAPRVA